MTARWFGVVAVAAMLGAGAVAVRAGDVPAQPMAIAVDSTANATIVELQDTTCVDALAALRSAHGMSIMSSDLAGGIFVLAGKGKRAEMAVLHCESVGGGVDF